MRHLETTPAFKEALLNPSSSDDSLSIRSLKVDLLFNSPSQESQQLAVDVAKAIFAGRQLTDS